MVRASTLEMEVGWWVCRWWSWNKMVTLPQYLTWMQTHLPPLSEDAPFTGKSIIVWKDGWKQVTFEWRQLPCPHTLDREMVTWKLSWAITLKCPIVILTNLSCIDLKHQAPVCHFQNVAKREDHHLFIQNLWYFVAFLSMNVNIRSIHFYFFNIVSFPDFKGLLSDNVNLPIISVFEFGASKC